MAMKKSGSCVRVSWQDMFDWSSEASSGAEHDVVKNGWCSARFSDESLRGQFEAHFFPSSFMIIVADLYVDHDLEITATQDELKLGFGLGAEGCCVRYYKDERGRTAEVAVNAGFNVVGAYRAKETSVRLTGGQTHKVVSLRFTEASVAKLIQDWQTHLPQPISRMLLGHQSMGADIKKPLSPALECTTHQALQCPYEGVGRHLFMEAKALEILARQIGEFSEGERESGASYGPEEAERLHYAREILEVEYADPPSLVELAHRAGMNDFKLKRGFRELFGTTVFSYVRKLRMEKARSLLEGSSLTITEVALETGYKSFGHFAAAFKRSFGVLPSRYPRRRRLY